MKFCLSFPVTLMEIRRATKKKLILGFLLVLYPSITCTHAADTISANQTIRYNQNRPLTDTSGELTLSLQGVLMLQDGTTGSVVWSSANSSTTSVRNPMGRLLDTGNFVIYEEGDNSIQESPIWQSFDFLTDTLLPRMKEGWDLVTGIERRYTSWKSKDDPASSEFSAGIDIIGYPQMILMDGLEIRFRAGPWNGLRFSGAPNFRTNPIYNFTFVLNQKEIYFQYDLLNSSIFTRLVLQPTGHIERLLWIDSKQDWSLYAAPEMDRCDQYTVCGPFASCSIDKSPACECLKGFEPVSPEQWRVADWSQGCRHTVPLNCEPGEGFNKYSHLKLPDTRGSWYNQTMTLVECEKMCKSNCSCTAYTNLNISGTRSGCLLWFGDLIDIKTIAENEETLYIRLPPSELEKGKSSSAARRVLIIVPVAFVALVILVSICLFCRYNWKKQQLQGTTRNEFRHDHENGSDDDLELPLFGLSTLLKATNSFSINNKLGEGGFGPVYKGILEDGQEIAAKRLAKTSTQGVHEFKNEVLLISKLQHHNLVKLLGCCIEVAEKMLIYEYMPNKGLDSIIFDKTQSELLDWSSRYCIIIGITRGLLYLHQDSRLRIIHRDLKLSNILLDKDMNPRISYFGMARTFGGNQVEANTNRVVGTYGYMAPVYAGDGMFSIKYDVYSFGVLVLEIVCGEKNRGFVNEEHWNNLIGYASGLHNEGKSLQLVAKCLGRSINISQVQRSIHVGLLCVQGHPEDRPTMTSVITMLESEGPLPSPKAPGFYVGKTKQETTQSSSSYGTSSTNALSITMLSGR